MPKKLKIAVVSSEVDPFSKSGGLADVARSLSKALFYLGHQVIVITPFYEKIIDKKNLKLIKEKINLEIDSKNSVQIDYWQGELTENLPVYFVKNVKYFSKRKELYGSDHENSRFFLFDLAALTLLPLINFKPDIIQCHDWQSGLIPCFLKNKLRFKHDPFFKKISSVFTIHNLSFQLGKNWGEIPLSKKDYGRKKLPFFHTQEMENINFAKRGILCAETINTVSEQYAHEILTKEFGQDLQGILRKRNKEGRLYGIINGIDYFDYNPKTDPGLIANYDFHSLENKEKNKLYLQKKFKLKKGLNLPLLGMVTRITQQKGFDLLIDSLDPLLRLDLQIIIFGGGDKKYEKIFKKIEKKSDKLRANLKFNTEDATKIYAGTDMFLMPSLFEPCGLTQLISLRYGSIPIVRAVGGLADTIQNYNPRNKQGNGFVFKTFDSRDFIGAITRALETYKYPEVWKKLTKQSMKQSFSWEISAKKYIQLFQKALSK